ncbi:biotin-dependent carboxyltransferase family protein [Peribacillus simplex]|uniref:5-oxoprolinase subunit C family protein n=1 Tax=Peribacillus simplex TaxID=1478 RepID=UPI000F641A38|nr:biotin-dependent carboxyltransferase family protein [Peribacillus simplex]RRN69996.1 biotin-dependent carboxyltransferase family protein [Peribacillus simplex]
MSLRVIKPGLLTSIQDLGRKGFQQHGVIVSGAMDAYSLRIANMLVGNKEDEAAMEITLMGPTLKIEKNCLIAITGGNLSPTIDSQTVPMWKPIYVKKGTILRFEGCKSGCRSYLSVAGGYAISTVMNSKSTYLRGEIGGFEGRALKVDDVVDFNVTSTILNNREFKEAFTTPKWFVNDKEFMPGRMPAIRFIDGSQYDYFTDSSKVSFTENLFKVSNQSDRMGYRISGPLLELNEKRELLSEAVTNGSVQVPPDGNPIILLADSQTTGGYPKIAQVITADLPMIAQIKPGESIQFSRVTLKEAEQLLLQKEQQLKELKVSISLALKKQQVI